MKVTETAQAPRFPRIVMPHNENHIFCVLQMREKKEVIFIVFFDDCCCCGWDVHMCVHVCVQARGQHQVSDLVIV